MECDGAVLGSCCTIIEFPALQRGKLKSSLQLRQMTSKSKQTLLAGRTTPGITLVSFAAVLVFALPYFIYSKRQNEQKKKDRHMAELRGGAFNQMNSGRSHEAGRGDSMDAERVEMRRAKSVGSQGAQIDYGSSSATPRHFLLSPSPIDPTFTQRSHPDSAFSIRHSAPHRRQGVIYEVPGSGRVRRRVEKRRNRDRLLDI